jgi:hypothetical protein
MFTSRIFYSFFLLSIISFVISGYIIGLPELMAPDSATYLNGSPRRTVGYPIFLKVVGWLNPSYSLLPMIQTLVYSFAAAFLVYSYSRFIKNQYLNYLFIVTLSLNPIIWIYNGQLLAESLFMSLTMFCLGLIVNAIHSKNNSLHLILLGSIIAIMILVKPVGYAYFSIILFILFFIKSNKVFSLLKLIFPLVIILLLASFKNYYSNGVFATQVFGGFNLLGQVVPIMNENDLDHEYTEINSKIAKSVSTMTNELPSELSAWRKHFFLTAFSYNKGLSDYAIPIIFDVYDMEDSSELEKFIFLNSLAWDISLTAIVNNPLEYARHVFSNFLGLWYLPTVTSRNELIELKNYLCSDVFSGFFTKSDCDGIIKGTQIPKNIVYLKNFIFSIILFSSIILICFSLFRFKSISLIYSFGLFPAVMINSHHILVSLLEAGLSRYALATWPLLVTLAIFILYFLTLRLKKAVNL